MLTSPLFQSELGFNPAVIADTYSDDNTITLHNGDSRTFLKTIPNGAISLVITSPPYNIGKSYERRQGITAYLAEQEVVISELVRVLNDQGSICWQTGNYVDDGRCFPLTFITTPSLKSTACNYAIGLFGTLSMVCTHQKDFLVAMKPSCGLPRLTTIHS